MPQKRIKIKEFNEIKIGDLIDYNSKTYLILDSDKIDTSVFKLFDFETGRIIENKSLYMFKHKLFKLEQS